MIVPPVEVDVLHPKAQSLDQAHAGTIEEQCLQTIVDVHQRKESLNLLARQDDREAHASTGPANFPKPRQIDPQHALVEEQKGAKCLFVGRYRSFAGVGKMHQVRLDLGGSHVARMA